MQDLAKSLKLSYQQVQKYESGCNRVGASRLYELCSILGVPISFFFEDIPPQRSVPSDRQDNRAPETNVNNVLDKMGKRETLEIVRAFCEIEDANVRKKLLALARLLAKQSVREA